jgi:hypothetical protein
MAGISQAVKMICDFIQAWVRKQILSLWSLLRNTSFSMTGKILVIYEETEFKTFRCLPIYIK